MLWLFSSGVCLQQNRSCSRKAHPAWPRPTIPSSFHHFPSCLPSTQQWRSRGALPIPGYLLPFCCVSFESTFLFLNLSSASSTCWQQEAGRKSGMFGVISYVCVYSHAGEWRWIQVPVSLCIVTDLIFQEFMDRSSEFSQMGTWSWSQSRAVTDIPLAAGFLATKSGTVKMEIFTCLTSKHNALSVELFHLDWLLSAELEHLVNSAFAA